MNIRLFKPSVGKEEVKNIKKAISRSWLGLGPNVNKFEKEWEIIANAVEEEQNVFLESELGEVQRAKVEMLSDKILSLNVFEHRYLAKVIKSKVQKATGLNPLKMNLDWPSVKQDSTGTWPPANPNWFK